MSWHCGAVGLGVDFAVDGLRLKGFESRLGRVFQTCVCISYHDNVTKTVLNQDSKLGCTSIENGYSVTTVDYLAIVDYLVIVDYPQIITANFKEKVPQCGSTATHRRIRFRARCRRSDGDRRDSRSRDPSNQTCRIRCATDIAVCLPSR